MPARFGSQKLLAFLALGLTQLQVGGNHLRDNIRSEFGKHSSETIPSSRTNSSENVYITARHKLFLLRDQDAYTGPMVMPQPRRRGLAQGHHTHLLRGKRIPCL